MHISNINNNMEFEDSRNALFCDPNAYIQNFNITEKCEPKKVVFQEPYEQLPSFYINNDFRKHNCNCVPKSKHTNCSQNKYDKFDCDRNHNNQTVNRFNNHCGCNNSALLNNHDDCQNNNQNQKFFGFDIKSLLPLLGMFNKGGGMDLSSLVGLLNNNSVSLQNSNPMGLISTLMSNKDIVGGVLNLFKGGGLNLFGKKQSSRKEIETTDFEIKNYTRVE